MRHRKDGYKLGRLTQHRWALFRNLLVALFRHDRIRTTEAKAKAVRGLADRMLTLARQDTLHARRQVLQMVPDVEVVRRLFDTVAARSAGRQGGYTRIVKAGVRPGDAAPVVLLELVDRPATEAKAKDKDAGPAKPKRERKRGDAGAARGARPRPPRRARSA